jgi:hypothetical protein
LPGGRNVLLTWAGTPCCIHTSGHDVSAQWRRYEDSVRAWAGGVTGQQGFNNNICMRVYENFHKRGMCAMFGGMNCDVWGFVKKARAMVWMYV